MEKYYNIRAAAPLLGMAVRTVRQWVHDGKIKAVQYARRGKWYVLHEDTFNRLRKNLFAAQKLYDRGLQINARKRTRVFYKKVKNL